MSKQKLFYVKFFLKACFVIFLIFSLLITIFGLEKILLFTQQMFFPIKTIYIGNTVIEPSENWLEVGRIKNGQIEGSHFPIFPKYGDTLKTKEDQISFYVVDKDNSFFVTILESKDFFLNKFEKLLVEKSEALKKISGCIEIEQIKESKLFYCYFDIPVSTLTFNVLQKDIKINEGNQSNIFIIKLNDALVETFYDNQIKNDMHSICWPEKEICVNGIKYNDLGKILSMC